MRTLIDISAPLQASPPIPRGSRLGSTTTPTRTRPGTSWPSSPAQLLTTCPTARAGRSSGCASPPTTARTSTRHTTTPPRWTGGARAITIDEVPLEWCFQPAVKLDFRHFPDGYVATAADVEGELARIGHELAPLEIVVVNTRAGARYSQDDYVSSGCGIGRDATLYLLERGVRLTCTDAWSWDAPFVHTAARYAVDHDPSIIWEGHRAGREIGYCHLEKLHGLEALPATGFEIACFPVKVHAASAGWTRAVAIFHS
jgi:kynurenine formamidase